MAGSSGAYFSIADHILQMDTYRAYDITDKVRKICGIRAAGQTNPGSAGTGQASAANNIWSQEGRCLRVGRLERRHDQIKLKQFGRESFSIGRETVDLKYVEQIVDTEQTTTLSYIMRYVTEQLEKNPGQEIGKLLSDVCCYIEFNGPGSPGRQSGQPGNLAIVRPQEIYACVNRYRGFNRR